MLMKAGILSSSPSKSNHITAALYTLTMWNKTFKGLNCLNPPFWNNNTLSLPFRKPRAYNSHIALLHNYQPPLANFLQGHSDHLMNITETSSPGVLSGRTGHINNVPGGEVYSSERTEAKDGCHCGGREAGIIIIIIIIKPYLFMIPC